VREPARTRCGRAAHGPQPLEHIAAVSLRLIACGEYEQASRLIHRLDPARARSPASW
jgi:hypothetical protein